LAGLTHKERLQPSLLDRLRDDNPERKQESRDQRVISVQKLRACVLRDLGWLFNAVNLSSIQDLSNYPESEKSVINFGMPDLAGHTASSVEIHALERLLKQVILDYEPRLLRNSIRVKLKVSESRMNHNAMTFDIEADLWADPLPLHMYMKTEIDLEIGEVQVSEFSARSIR
jgi:type VI secretion system protein ImpF